MRVVHDWHNSIGFEEAKQLIGQSSLHHNSAVFGDGAVGQNSLNHLDQ
jgi:hypothetical protein